MIPKVIHYCWFGGAPKSTLIKKCIKSWSKYCPDYKIIEWNEGNFDIETAPTFVKQAYQYKKWAFVTDYVRLKVIYDNGGIYFDTDVELIKTLDGFLQCDAFFGFNDNNRIATGLVLGAKKGCDILTKLMESYLNISFVKKDGTFDLTDNTQRDSLVFEKLGLKLDNSFQIIDNCVFYPREYFCPKDKLFSDINTTKNTVAIHHFAATWTGVSKLLRKKNLILRRHRRFLNDLKLVKSERGLLHSVFYALKHGLLILK